MTNVSHDNRTNMVPPAERLTHVLPTATLAENGRPRKPFRDELYAIPNLRNAFTVAFLWVQSLGVVIAACLLHNPIVWVIAFMLMSRACVLHAILGHEAAHRLLFTNKAVNDWVGKWLVGYPMWFVLDGYRRVHMAHHRDEFGPNEPDIAYYRGYPITKASWRRKLIRDAVGISGYKNLRGFFMGWSNADRRRSAISVLAWQAALMIGFTVAGYPLAWPLLWFLPWMTSWRVMNRLRAVAEHGGMIRSDDRRETTHHIEQHWLARFWIVPYNTGWHLAHHVDSGVPFRALPRLHRELVDAQWVTPEITHRNYLRFWRTCVR